LRKNQINTIFKIKQTNRIFVKRLEEIQKISDFLLKMIAIFDQDDENFVEIKHVHGLNWIVS